MLRAHATFPICLQNKRKLSKGEKTRQIEKVKRKSSFSNYLEVAGRNQNRNGRLPASTSLAEWILLQVNNLQKVFFVLII